MTYDGLPSVPETASAMSRSTALLPSGLLLVLATACGSGEPSAPPERAAEAPPEEGASQPVGADGPTRLGSPRVEIREGVAPPRQGAALMIRQTVHDFGAVSDVEDLRHSFPFVNGGNDRLVIEDVKTTCGCTTTSLDQTEFEPGEGDDLEVVWKPLGYGKQTKTITIRSNTAGTGLTLLRVSAEITPFVRVEPNILKLEPVRRGEVLRELLSLECDDPAWAIEEVSTNSEHLAARVVTGPGGDGPASIEVLLLPTTPWGRFFGKVDVRVRGRLPSGGDPIEHTFTVSVQGFVYDGVVVDPPFFAVGRVVPGESFEYEVGLTSPEGTAFSIVEAKVINPTVPGTTVTVEPREEGGYALVLRGESGEYEGPVQGQVSFSTNLPSDTFRTLPIMGIVR